MHPDQYLKATRHANVMFGRSKKMKKTGEIEVGLVEAKEENRIRSLVGIIESRKKKVGHRGW